MLIASNMFIMAYLGRHVRVFGSFRGLIIGARSFSTYEDVEKSLQVGWAGLPSRGPRLDGDGLIGYIGTPADPVTRALFPELMRAISPQSGATGATGATADCTSSTRMGDAFSVAASALAVAELSAKVISLCLQYSREVKHAKENIERVKKEIATWKNVVEALQSLLKSPDGTNLQISQDLPDALEGGRAQLEWVYEKLAPSRRRQAMKQFGLRALKWPFNSKEVEKIVKELARCMQPVTTALQVDQTVAVLKIDKNLVNFNQGWVLDKLPFAADAGFDSHAEEHNSICLPNTRVDLLREIEDWVEDPTAKAVFWLNGMAGTGKSTISRTLARSSTDRGQLGASFFFKRGGGDRGGVSKFFTTITAQLIRREPALAVHVKDAIDADPTIFHKAMREQFEKLILNPLSRLSSRDREADVLVIVVDALDECEREEDARLIIRLLSRAKVLNSPRLRIFLTSRPELSIRRTFHLDPVESTYQDLILHDVEESVIESDLFIYFEYKLSEIRKEYNFDPLGPQLPLAWPGQLKIQALVEMAIPLFIFAATACLFLADSRIGTPDMQLKKLLEYQTKSQESKLDATYLPVLNQLLVNLSNPEEKEVLERFRRIIGSVILLANPLSTPALADLLGISQNDIDNHLKYLHSVLSIPSLPDSPVRLLHLSFRDFLVDPSKRGKNPFWIDEKEAHKQLAADCLRVMNETLRTDICNVKWPGTSYSSIDPHIINEKLTPQVQYACQYWVYHLQQAADLTVDNDKVQVHHFLQQHFLHWLEALSLLGRAFESLHSIRLLQSLLQSESCIQGLHFINDALRFARTNISAIQATPLQAYCSALAFAPEKSIIRDTFRSNIPDWISLRPNVNTHWSNCLQILEGHTSSVESVAFSFSPDSSILASGSDDYTVRLWKADTGECLYTLEGHTDSVRSVAFSPSPDRSILASGSKDHTVRVWKVDTGKCLHTLKGHTSSVLSVAFSPSPDSSILASGSKDHTARVWKVDTGECLCTLKGHTDWVRSVAFSPSPDSSILASGSDDYTVRVWKVDTGECLCTLKGHTDWVRSVAFSPSPDRSILASGSDDHTVRLWKADTGKCLYTLEGHTDSVRSVAFSPSPSPDSSILASGSDDYTVRLWKADTGKCLNTLKGHASSVRSAAFSPNSNTLASGSHDSTVRLWKANTSECLNTLKVHTSSVRSVAFSPNSSTLASGSDDKTVQLWKADTGECLYTLKGHTDWVLSVAFSPNSCTLASGSGDKTVRVWKADTGECLYTLKGHTDSVCSVTFSPNGSTLASGSHDKTVRVWKADIGECLRILKGHTDWVYSVAFSPDGSILASGSGDKTVRVWRAVTGECLRSIYLGVISFELSFNPDDRSLLTEVGVISFGNLLQRTPIAALDNSESPTSFFVRALPDQDQHCYLGYGISKDRCWITLNGKNLLWLPTDYRPGESAVFRSTVVIGTDAGNVVIMRFSGPAEL
ncbi:vegetative incompatibility protein HET-E-1 [Xylariaceae sp. AK1471]|nr:vegetative incompatibility protein HET-E-1 [Xylariaceae sp. AK1471]